MVSRGLRIFCSSEELWRTRVIEELPEGAPLRYSGTWLQTYLQQTTSRPCDGARVNAESELSCILCGALRRPAVAHVQ